MPGRAEHLAGGARLDDAAGIHHRDAVAELRHHPEIVGDEQHRHAELPSQAVDEIEDLGLHGDVEGRGGLVRDEKVGLVRERDGDHHALALAAGELVRIALERTGRRRNADEIEEVHGSLASRRRADRAMQQHRLLDLRAHREHGVQRGHRLLEDHADAIAAQPPQRLALEPQQILLLEQNPPARDAPRRMRDELHHGERRDGFAAARFADQPHHLAGLERERHRLDHGLAAHGDGEVFDREKRACHAASVRVPSWREARVMRLRSGCQSGGKRGSCRLEELAAGHGARHACGGGQAQGQAPP
jgi:hypothetical protein